MGDKIDVDFGDLLDFFALDGATRAILLYSRIDQQRAQSSCRRRERPPDQAGRRGQVGPPCAGAKAAQTHTGALAGADSVYDAAFRRAGLLRVLDLDELFAAAETLGRVQPFSGKRLAILTNGGGIGVLAVDRLVDLGGTLADISPQTMLNGSTSRYRRSGRMPTPSTSPAMPTPARYVAALEALLRRTRRTMPSWS